MNTLRAYQMQLKLGSDRTGRTTRRRRAAGGPRDICTRQADPRGDVLELPGGSSWSPRRRRRQAL